VVGCAFFILYEQGIVNAALTAQFGSVAVPFLLRGNMKYRKKPIVIEAIQWTGDNIEEISDFIDLACDWNYKDNKKKLIIKTLEGDMLADQHDWIIKGVKDEFYPCKPDIFNQTYELCE